MTKHNKIVILFGLIIILAILIYAEHTTLSNLSFTKISEQTAKQQINQITDINKLRAAALQLNSNHYRRVNEVNNNVEKTSIALIVAGLLILLSIIKITFSFFIKRKENGQS